MKSILYVLGGIVFLIASCSPPVVFDQPYPLNGADLSSIPSAYQGAFICESDSSLVLVQDKQIVVRQENYFLLPLKDVEEIEDCTIQGNEMFVPGRAECIPLEFLNDSLVKGIVVEYDTLFSIHKTSVVRDYLGHAVLSAELKDGQWAISFLSLEKNQDVKYRAITDKSKIRTIGKVTHMEDITTKEDKNNRYMIRPSMKEFEDLFKDEKVFLECEYLTRVQLSEVLSRPILLDDLGQNKQ